MLFELKQIELHGPDEAKVVFKGDREACDKFATTNGYEYKRAKHLLFGGYYVNGAGDCLMPDIPARKLTLGFEVNGVDCQFEVDKKTYDEYTALQEKGHDLSRKVFDIILKSTTLTDQQKIEVKALSDQLSEINQLKVQLRKEIHSRRVNAPV